MKRIDGENNAGISVRSNEHDAKNEDEHEEEFSGALCATADATDTGMREC